MNRTRRGFSLIEIVTVAAIAALLMAMFFMGYKYVSQRGRTDQTTVALNTLKGMLTEYEVQGGSMTVIEQDYGGSPAAAPGLVAEGGADRNGTQVQYTRKVMRRLLSIPDNTKAMANMPPDLILRPGDGDVLLLDGYRNPIIYVPAAGLSGAMYGGSAKVVRAPSTTRGFFASAGEDGDFSKADDNVYSFDK